MDIQVSPLHSANRTPYHLTMIKSGTGGWLGDSNGAKSTAASSHWSQGRDHVTGFAAIADTVFVDGVMHRFTGAKAGW